MKFARNCLLPLALALFLAPATTPASIIVVHQTPKMVGPASEVLKMAQSGVETNVILAFIESNAAPFGMSAENVLDLRAQGVSADVIAAMLRHDAQIVHVSRTIPPISAPSPSPLPNEDASTTNAPPRQADIMDASQGEPYVGGFDWVTPGGANGRGFNRSFNRGIRARPALASQTVPSIPGTVSLLQPTVPLLQPVVPLVRSPIRTTPGRPAFPVRGRN